MPMLYVKEQQHTSEQFQVVSSNLSKSVETPTLCDHVEFWVSQHGNSFPPHWRVPPLTDGLLPPLMNSLLPSSTNSLPPWQTAPSHRWMASSCQQMVNGLPFQRTAASLNDWPPPSLNKQPCSSTNGPLPQQMAFSLNKWPPPSTNIKITIKWGKNQKKNRDGWWWCWVMFSGSSAHFQIRKYALFQMKNSKKIEENQGKK